jgi:hypothetical protein
MNGQPIQYFRDGNGNIVFVRNPYPEDKGNFWGHPTPNGILPITTQGGHPDIYDEEYLPFYNNDLMFAEIGPPKMAEQGRTDDLGGRTNPNPAVRQQNKTLISRSQYDLDRIVTPTDLTLPGEVAQLAEVIGDQPQTFAKKSLRRDSQLTAYALVDSPDMTTYFSNLGFDPNKPSPLADPLIAAGAGKFFGSTVLVGQLTIGHGGVSQDITFDLPAMQLVKVPFNGMVGQLRARLYPKYYFPNDTVAGTRTYNIGDFTIHNVPVTNITFNNGPPSQLALQAMTNTNPARVRGWISEGSNATDELGRATRSFSGSVPITGPFAVTVQCPIAWFANAVMLRGGQLVAGVAESVAFLITDYQGKQTGPYPPNTIIPIGNSIESIQVVSPTGVTVTEAPFELLYFISI